MFADGTDAHCAAEQSAPHRGCEQARHDDLSSRHSQRPQLEGETPEQTPEDTQVEGPLQPGRSYWRTNCGVPRTGTIGTGMLTSHLTHLRFLSIRRNSSPLSPNHAPGDSRPRQIQWREQQSTKLWEPPAPGKSRLWPAPSIIVSRHPSGLALTKTSTPTLTYHPLTYRMNPHLMYLRKNRKAGTSSLSATVLTASTTGKSAGSASTAKIKTLRNTTAGYSLGRGRQATSILKERKTLGQDRWEQG